MIERGLLMVSHPDIAAERIGSWTILERQIATAAAAGIKELWIGGRPPQNFPQKPLPQTISIYWISQTQAPAAPCLPPYLSLSDQHLIDPAELKLIAQGVYQTPFSFLDPQGRAVVQVVAGSTQEFRAPEKFSLHADAAILLERPFKKTGVVKWAQKRNLPDSRGWRAMGLSFYLFLTRKFFPKK